MTVYANILYWGLKIYNMTGFIVVVHAILNVFHEQAALSSHAQLDSFQIWEGWDTVGRLLHLQAEERIRLQCCKFYLLLITLNH